MVKCKKYLIEAHLVKITAEKRLPKPRGKGTGAEVERRGGRFAGSSDKIRPAVAFAESYPIPSSRTVGSIGSCLAAAFFHA